MNSLDIKPCLPLNANEYVKFFNAVHKKNSNYRDNFSSIIKDFLTGKIAFCQNNRLFPFFVYNGYRPLAVCIFIIAKKMPDILQMAFFAAEEEAHEAVDLLMQKARELCSENNIQKIVVGLNGSLSYGVGLLANNYEKRPGFGKICSPAYYFDFFTKYSPETQSMTSIRQKLDDPVLLRFMDNPKSRHNIIRCRKARFNNLREEIRTYVELSNQSFMSHPFYYERDIQENYELFAPFKTLLKEENLIFAEDNGKPVGFLLWYPDYNELIAPGKGVGFSTFFKYKILKRPIKTFMYVEMAILPDYQGSRVLMSLMKKCFSYVRNDFTWGETSWVFDSNKVSLQVSKKWTPVNSTQYKVLLIDANNVR
ncbi:MAG: hypothetical protein HQK83_13215 [Fibrobacteria bacterium]|nr:hypothetical protein [Fibrobacteria bacterium]